MKDLPFTALLKPTIVRDPSTDTAGLTVGIDGGSRGNLFRRMDSLEERHPQPLGAEIPQCRQLESLHPVSYLQ